MNAKAQDYLPVLTEGKVWNCLYKDLAMAGAGQEPDKLKSASAEILLSTGVCARGSS